MKDNDAIPTPTDLVVFVLDETGSMGGIQGQTISGFNEYLNELKKVEAPTHFTLIKFSTKHFSNKEKSYRLVTDAVPLAEVKDLTDRSYSPDGSTPLWDAVGEGLKLAEKQAKKVGAERIIFTILTDGFENCSTEYTAESVKREIEAKQELGNWTITYLGANQDAWAVGQQMGVFAGNSMTFASTSRGVTKTMGGLAVATNTLRGSSARASESYYASAGLTEQDFDDSEVKNSKLWTPSEGIVPGDRTPGEGTVPGGEDKK